MNYRGFPRYHRLIGALKEVPVVVKEEFREGNEHPGARAVAFLEDCRKALPCSKRIGHLGSDSALYQAGVINCCRENHITFTIRADQDSAVKKAIEGLPEGDLRPFYDRDGIDCMAGSLQFHGVHIAYSIFTPAFGRRTSHPCLQNGASKFWICIKMGECI